MSKLKEKIEAIIVIITKCVWVATFVVLVYIFVYKFTEPPSSNFRQPINGQYSEYTDKF